MSSIQSLMKELDRLLQASGWEVRHDLPDIDMRGLTPDARALIPQTGRVYALPNAILVVQRQTSCTIAGYLDEAEAEPAVDNAEAEPAVDDAELASGYTGPRAVPVTSFDAEIDEDGKIQLTEILFDMATQSVKKVVTAIDSVEALCDRVVKRTEAEIDRRIAQRVPN